jgi:hypothetical protein
MNEAKSLAAELVSSDSQSQAWRTRRGTMTLTWTESGSLLVVVGTHGDRVLAPLMTKRADAMVLRSRMMLFFDFWTMPTYDSEMRTEWTSWLVSHRARLDGLHVVARSKLVSMGVSVANLALGGIIKSYPAATGPFEKALKAAGLEPAR